uniref:BROMI middle region domain-containing protein n=1 Tax=Schistocephalus solidus TaxID=70667 RepID=A0A0X3P3E5_SCHSO
MIRSDMNEFVEPLQALIFELQSTGCTESYEQILQEIGSKKTLPHSSEKGLVLLKILETQVDTFLEKNKALILNAMPDGLFQVDSDVAHVIHSKEFTVFHNDIRENLRAAMECILRRVEEEGQQDNSEGSEHTDSSSTISGTLQADVASLASTETESIDRISGVNRPPYDQRGSRIVEEHSSVMTESPLNERTRQASVAESSFSGSLTQEGCTFLSQTELAELARLLDPQNHSIAERTTALRQIVNLPVLDVQACESWMAAASLQTPTQQTLTVAHEQASTSSQIFSLPATTSTDEVSASVWDPSNLPPYSIRTGILEALNDEDEELWSLAMQFLAKGFATTSANVKECYCVLTEYIEDQFSGGCGPLPKLISGLDISNPRMHRLFRAFCLFNEVNKQITQLWLRYPEKHVLTILDRCLSIFTIGGTNVATTDVSLTPVHFISLLDPQATWFAKWTKGAYSCRPLLTKLKNNRHFITACLAVCLRFLRGPQCDDNSSTENLPQQFVYSGSQVDAAHFLHSLHVLVWLLCLREGRKLFPLRLSDQRVAHLSRDEIPTQIDNYRKVQVGDVVASLLWFLRNPHIGSGPDKNCRTLASSCLLRLSESPFAHELFRSNSEGSATVRSRKQKRPDKCATAPPSPGLPTSICSVLVEPISALLRDLANGLKFQDIEVHRYEVCCQFTQVLVNLSRSPAGRTFITRQEVLVDRQQPLLSRISHALCYLLGVVRAMLAGQVPLPAPSDNPAKLIGNLSRILCQTCLTPEGMESCAKFSIHIEALETWKAINAELKTSSTICRNTNVLAADF